MTRYLRLTEVEKLVGENCCLACAKNIFSALSRSARTLPKEFGEEFSKICREEGVNEEILYEGNHAQAVRVRRKFAVAMKARGHSLPAIGAFLGKHHTTVLSLVDPDLRRRRRSGESSASGT